MRSHERARRPPPIDKVTQDFWDERMAVNLRHQYFAIQSVVPGMKVAEAALIVNFSSVSHHSDAQPVGLPGRKAADDG